MRTCWVLDMWNKSNQQAITLKPLTAYGWKIQGEQVLFDWDSDENMTTGRQRVESLMKGYHCKTGCKSGQCGCKKKERDVQKDVNVCAAVIKTF